MALWLPRLPTDRLRRVPRAPPEHVPLAVYTKSANAFTLSAVDRCASAASLHQGMSLADARAMRPDLIARETDDDADLKMLDHIAAWCERFTPIVVIDGADGLFLDISGCAHLYGGESALLEALLTRLDTQGFAAQAAIAPNPASAWAFARCGTARIVDDPELIAALSPLPIAALRLAPAAAALLKRLGLKTIGQIIHAPRAPFSARAGQQTMLRLDQALGRAREALSPRRPPPPIYASRRLLEPILSLEAIVIVLKDVCADLAEHLDRAGAGTRLLRLTLFGVDGRTRQIELGLSKPERDAKPMLRLLRERLTTHAENFDAEFGFDAVRLDAVEIAPIHLQATDLAPVSARDPAAEARLIDMLAARLGAGRVGRVSVCDTHAPERATLWNDSAGAVAPPPSKDGVMRRPLRLFKRAQAIEAMASVPDGPPLRFRWRRVLHEVARAEGPERIAPNWLRAPENASRARTRDYYRVEDSQGRRYWLYREGFYDEHDAPRWFLHGLFA
jgi:protein ImuB